MADNNDELIGALESAKRLVVQLTRLVDQSQADCSHPTQDLRNANRPDAPPRIWGKPWCRRCHKVLT